MIDLVAAKKHGYAACETAVSEGIEPKALIADGQLGADEALVNALGFDGVAELVGLELTDSVTQEQWDAVCLPWLAEYAKAYRERAYELTHAEV